jgi:hypothetical protein
MKHITHIIAISAAPAFIVLNFRHPAVDPYLDAGTGSIIIQALIGGAVGALLVLKIYWNRISTFFKNRFSRGEKHEGAPK